MDFWILFFLDVGIYKIAKQAHNFADSRKLFQNCFVILLRIKG